MSQREEKKKLALEYSPNASTIASEVIKSKFLGYGTAPET